MVALSGALDSFPQIYNKKLYNMMINDFAMLSEAQNKSRRRVGYCVCERVLVIWFYSVNFSWRQKLKHGKAQLNEDKLRRKIQFVKKTVSKTSLSWKMICRESLSCTQYCLTGPRIITAKKRRKTLQNEIHKTQHFIKV